MSEKIEPALGAAEWEERSFIDDSERRVYALAERGDTHVEISEEWGRNALAIRNVEDPHESESYHRTPEGLRAIIALANDALPDSDRAKITREKIAVILDVALYQQANGTYPDSSPFSEETLAQLKSLYGALESYLPPEKPAQHPAGPEFYNGGMTYHGGPRAGAPVDLKIGELMPSRMQFWDAPGGEYFWNAAHERYEWDPV